MEKSILQYLSPEIILATICILVVFFLLVIKRKEKYGIVTMHELKIRLDKLIRFSSIIYLSIFMLWGMFILPIKSMTGIIPTLRSLVYMLAAITIAYIAHKVIFYHRILIYAFAIASTVFLTAIILHHEGSFREMLTSAFL